MRGQICRVLIALGCAIGDVEVLIEGVLVSASKCKHRPLNLADVERGLGKNSRGVDYIFVTVGSENALVSKRIADAANSGNVSRVDATKQFPILLNLLGPNRRRKLGTTVASLLRQMREFDCAEEADRVWNRQ